MRKLLPTRRVRTAIFHRYKPMNRRAWSWYAELECGHVVHLTCKFRRSLSRKDREILERGHSRFVETTIQDYETGQPFTDRREVFDPVKDDEIKKELLPPPQYWGCRECPRGSNVLIAIARNLGPTRECLEHGRRMCRACGYRR
jgi:hypothetical protein